MSHSAIRRGDQDQAALLAILQLQVEVHIDFQETLPIPRKG
jgi:hypothetical protein